MLTLTQHSLFTLIYILLVTINLSNGADRDITTLLSFKAAISNDPLNSLSNWNTSSNTATICSWTGITCDSNHVTGIDLTGQNISGQLPPSLFLLPNIHSLNLSGNQFYGSLPITTFSSSSILHLNLSSNNFTGPIPSPILQSSPIPLSTLDLSNNYLTGKIPITISNCRNLTYIDLGGNILTGEIPNSITQLTNLQHITLASNQLTGKIPLNQLPHLQWIYLGYNNLTGIIPPSLGSLTSLQHLDLVYNNLTGVIPPSIRNLTNLQTLFLYGNRLHGTIPTSIFSSLRNLTALDLSANSLSGEIPETISYLQNLEILQLFSNNFTGRIPSGLSSLPKLRVLQLWKNGFSGEIPSDLGNRNNLTVLDLSTNSLTGKLPVNLCGSRKLTKLILFSNKLVGPFPNSLGKCTSLERVRLMNNRLSGELPLGLTTLPAVNYMDLSGNHLNGLVTKTKWALPKLQMLSLANNRFHGPLPEITGKQLIETLDLSNNRFSGGIHRSYGELSELMELNLSRNEVGSEIPSELSWCKKMVRLDLSHNNLTGRIPRWIGELPVLGELDLSDNQLVGEIPVNLGSVDSLVQVNLSRNHLVGPLPSTPAFLDISNTAVTGNELCGGDLTTTRLPACNSLTKTGAGKTGFTWWSLLVTSFLILFLAITVICTIYSLIIILIRRKTQSAQPHSNTRITFQKFNSQEDSSDSVWEYHLFKSSPNISIHQIISSIRTCDSQQNIILIGDSSGGTSRIMVERQFILPTKDGSTSVDDVVVTKLSQIPASHRNLVRINGVCRKLVKKECCEVYLIYEMPPVGDGGDVKTNLSSVLHGLSWEQRSKVAIGVCKVLRYLHCNGMVVGDLSSERILVDEDGECLMRPCSVVGGDKWFVSSPYFAPETKTANNTRIMMTEKNDIYGFGVLLIELLTGKSPTSITTTINPLSSTSTSRHQLHHHDSIVEWARHCYSDSQFEIWIDPVINRTTSISFNNYRDQMVETMRLALHCTANETEMRPCVTHVVKTLVSIMMMKRKKKISLPCVV